MPGSAPGGPGSTLARADELMRQGRLTEGTELAGSLWSHRDGETGDDTGDELGDEQRARVLGILVDGRLARGDLAGAMSLVADSAAQAALPGLAGARTHYAQGEVAAAVGDHDAAIAHFRRAGELAPSASPEEVPWRSGAALALLRAGDGKSAAALAHEEATLAETSGSPYALASALRTLAAVVAGPDRIQHLMRARGALAGTSASRLAAQIDTDLAGLLLLTGQPDAAPRALALLREAEDHAGRQELWPLQGRVRRLLDRLGEEPRKVESEAMAALTASERRVAKLAADGLTNRQIAAELVVTVKAVEWHLSHIYRKLGISSRLDLAETIGLSA